LDGLRRGERDEEGLEYGLAIVDVEGRSSEAVFEDPSMVVREDLELVCGQLEIGLLAGFADRVDGCDDIHEGDLKRRERERREEIKEEEEGRV